MDTTAFYVASSGLCFTLLGFWWVVVQFRHAELTSDRDTRQFIFLVSLHFIVPGVVSLASLLATGPMWRVAFGLAGLTGIIAAVAGTRAGSALPLLADVRRWARLGIPIYAVVTVVAFVPDVVRTGLGLEPLQVEGLLLLTILVLGILLAWSVFTGAQSGMAKIDVSCVTAANGWLCDVKVADGASETRHSVTFTRADFQRLTPSGGTPDALVRRSFEFLLAHEQKESILKSFALTDIGKYFPEYETEIGKR